MANDHSEVIVIIIIRGFNLTPLLSLCDCCAVSEQHYNDCSLQYFKTGEIIMVMMIMVISLSTSTQIIVRLQIIMLICVMNINVIRIIRYYYNANYDIGYVIHFLVL